MSSWFIEELRFRRHERKAILLLIILIVIVFSIRYLPISYDGEPSLSIEDVITIKEHIAQTESHNKANEQLYTVEAQYAPKGKEFEHNTHKKKPKPITRFSFDPNTVTTDQLESLGFKSYVAENWVKYRSTGKVYYSLDDLESIYGLDKNLLLELTEFVNFPAKPTYQKTEKYSPDTVSNSITKNKKYAKKEKNYNPAPLNIDLNSADAEKLQTIRGIGPVFSKRIVAYRDMIGGFHEVQQLKQVYGIHDSIYQNIKNHFKLKTPANKIPINSISESELGKTYFLNYKEAKVILLYRNQHGAFESATDFKKILGVAEEKKESIIPYLDFSL